MKSLFRLLPFFLVGFIFINLCSTPVNSVGSSDCKDFEVIFLRGSGQEKKDNDFTALEKALKAKIGSENYEILDLDYPAVSVSDFSVALSTIISAGESYEFKESVETGIKNLKSEVESETKKCKDKKFILAGYSQGAMVISKTLPSLNADKILYVGTFGDPKLYLPEGEDAKNRACKNIGLSNYRAYVPDCEVKEGILTALVPYQQPEYTDKLGAFCNSRDFMCGSKLDILNPLKAHLSYNSENGYEKFAEIVAKKITNSKSALTDKTKDTYSESSPKDVAVLFDQAQFWTSVSKYKEYSISSELKEKLVELGKKGARVALYNLYPTGNNSDPLELFSNFSNTDIDKAVDKLNQKNQYFHDYNYVQGYENMYFAMKKISTEASWQAYAEKNIYLITNVLHFDNRKSFDGTSFNDAVSAMKAAGVKLSVISESGEETSAATRNLISETGGTAIGSDLSKIKYSKNTANYQLKSKIFSKTFALDSDYTLVIVNDVVYGISKNNSITITNLDESLGNSVILVGFNSSGERVSKKTYTFSPNTISAPDCSSVSGY